MVIAADSLDALGLHLSFVEKKVLDSCEAEMAEGKIIARTPTFALFRSPATVVVAGNEHRKVNLNYAFCVEQTDGQTRRRALDVGARNGAVAPAEPSASSEHRGRSSTARWTCGPRRCLE